MTTAGGPSRRSQAREADTDEVTGSAHGSATAQGTTPGDHTHGKPDAAITRGRDYAETPLIVTWEVTRACSLACDHCRADAVEQRHPDELSTTAGRRLIDQVSRFDPAPVLVISGGDPLERPDLFDLIGYATERVPTAVTPAPTAALDATTVARFADHGVRRMALSLDGATAATHDAFRGEDGSFETVQQAADWAHEVDLDLQVNTTVTATTVDELPAIADQVARLEAVMWEVFFLVPIGRGTELDGITSEQAECVLEWLYNRASTAPYRVVTVEAPHYRRIAAVCEDGQPQVGSTRAGRGFVFVSHIGEVYPSGFLPVSVGNVQQTPLPTLYREADLMQACRDADTFSGVCGRCPYRRQCGGSRSRAYAMRGDPLASDPLCRRVADRPALPGDTSE